MTPEVFSLVQGFSLSDIDWWFWILIALLPTAKAIFFWWLFRAPKRSEPITSNVIEGKVLNVNGFPAEVDPVLVRLELDGEIEGRRDLLPLLRSSDGAHEHSSGGVRFEVDDSEFIFAVDSTAADSSGNEGQKKSLISKMKSSKGRKFQVAIVVTLRCPNGETLTGKTKPRTFESLELKVNNMREVVALSPKGNIELEISCRKIESNMDRLISSRKVLAAAFRQQKVLLVTSHLIAVGIFITLLSFGIRFLFSGAFACSITAIVLGALFALSSLPVLAVWAALGSLAHGGSMRKVTRLNSQFRAVLALTGAITLSLVTALTTSNQEAIQTFQFMSVVQIMNAISFAVAFVQFEAGGEMGALFHFNCLKRPVGDEEQGSA